MVVIDAGQPLTEQDQRIISTVEESGRAVVIAFNKWDLVDEERRRYLDREMERELVRVQWAPRINVTALTGWHVDRLVPALDRALAGWETRVPTGPMKPGGPIRSATSSSVAGRHGAPSALPSLMSLTR